MAATKIYFEGSNMFVTLPTAHQFMNACHASKYLLCKDAPDIAQYWQNIFQNNVFKITGSFILDQCVGNWKWPERKKAMQRVIIRKLIDEWILWWLGKHNHFSFEWSTITTGIPTHHLLQSNQKKTWLIHLGYRVDYIPANEWLEHDWNALLHRIVIKTPTKLVNILPIAFLPVNII